jgi:hypothetical protein
MEVGCGEGFSTQKLRGLLPRDCSLRASESCLPPLACWRFAA